MYKFLNLFSRHAVFGFGECRNTVIARMPFHRSLFLALKQKEMMESPLLPSEMILCKVFLHCHFNLSSSALRPEKNNSPLETYVNPFPKSQNFLSLSFSSQKLHSILLRDN